MTDIIILPDGSCWKPSTSSDTVHCILVTAPEPVRGEAS